MVLKKEIMKTQNKELEKAAEYRHLLVHAIHECAANFPDIAANVIHLLMDFLVRPLLLLCPTHLRLLQLLYVAGMQGYLKPLG